MARWAAVMAIDVETEIGAVSERSEDKDDASEDSGGRD